MTPFETSFFYSKYNEGTYKRDEQEKLIIFFKNLNLFIGDWLLLRLHNSPLLHADSYH